MVRLFLRRFFRNYRDFDESVSRGILALLATKPHHGGAAGDELLFYLDEHRDCITDHELNLKDEFCFKLNSSSFRQNFIEIGIKLVLKSSD